MFDEASANNVAILVTSCDTYQDLWEPFFTLFFRYWQDCPYPVYLGSNHKIYDDPRVETIAVGEERDWSSKFRYMLEAIPHPYIFIMMEDYLLTQPVDADWIERLIEHVARKGVGCMRLFPCPGPDIPCQNNPDIGILSKGADYRLSLQAAIWDKEVLLDLLREGESVWELEIKGTKRTNDLDVPFLSVIDNSPIPYICTGVNKGKWVKEAVELCKREGIEIDFTARSVQSPVDRFIRSGIMGKLFYFIRKNL